MERTAAALVLILALVLPQRPAAQDAAVVDRLTDRLGGAAVALSAAWQEGPPQEGLGLVIGRRGALAYVATARHVLAGTLPGESAVSVTVRHASQPGGSVTLRPDVVGPGDIDLAFFAMELPQAWRFDPGVLAPVGAAPAPGDAVWTLAPDTALGWRVNPAEGRIVRRLPSPRHWVVDRLPVRPSVSGAPLMSAAGVIGLVTHHDAEADTSRALDIALVAEHARLLGLPWDLTDRSEIRVRIRGGPFVMGARDRDLDRLAALLDRPADPWTVSAARPARTLDLAPFEIDATEVTWADFDAWNNADLPPGITAYRTSDTAPVVGVTWAEADAYCRARGQRLPTEAEWERAARGTGGRLFPWGDTLPGGPVVCADCGPGAPPDGPRPTGSAPADRTPAGVLDLGGNVREWVQDWYASDAYARARPGHLEQTAPRETRVVRGGSWFDPLGDLVTFRRGAERPDRRDPRIGFRCAQSLTGP